MKVLAIDQGTTSTRGFTLDAAGAFAFVAAREHRQIYPHPGWVEHAPEEILAGVRAIIAAAGPVDAGVRPSLPEGDCDPFGLAACALPWPSNLARARRVWME